ncbi:MAG: hypothetical protein IK108_00695 [Clostridia bacterium]|nr:hypothetical protein [Clostridia bacterium]
MKKQYTKPVLSFQSLAVSTDMSAGCAYEVNFAEFYCPVLIPDWGMTVFAEDSDCEMSNPDGFICYHVPTASFNVFGS